MISDNDNDKSRIDLRDRIMKGDGDGEIDLKRGQWRDRERNEFSGESQVSFLHSWALPLHASFAAFFVLVF